MANHPSKQIFVLLDLLHHSICLIKWIFLAYFLPNFSTICSHMLSKFGKKSIQKSLIFSNKANDARGLLSLFFLFGSLQAQDLPLKLTLEHAISQALNANRQLLGSVDTLTQAQFGVDLADSEFSLSITPIGQTGMVGGDRGKPKWQAGGGVEFSQKFSSGTTLSVIPSIVKRDSHYLTDVETSLVQPLFRGLGKEYQLSNLKSAQFALRTAYRDLYRAQVKLVLRTVEMMYEVIKQQKNAQLNRESFIRIEQFYRATKLKEKIGLSDPLDIYRAEIELRHAENAYKDSEERLEEALDQLRDLLALPIDQSIVIDVPTYFSPHPVDLDHAIKIALQTRIELDQANDETKENNRLACIAKQELYPEINLLLNYSNLGKDRHFSHSLTQGRDNRWEVGLTSSSEINSIGDQIAYKQSLLALTTAKRGTEQSESTVILEVKRAIRQLERALEKVLLEEEQIKTSKGELRLAKIKFDRGMADNFYLLQAEKSLRIAEHNFWNAMVEHILGEFELLASMGILLEKPRIRG